ncbi:MAG: site-specific integrase [Desulfovibrio sp.]|jgi:site-specific recombinase XerD|nr:site-specific integrase [Desulfovibrio sp.]
MPLKGRGEKAQLFSSVAKFFGILAVIATLLGTAMYNNTNDFFNALTLFNAVLQNADLWEKQLLIVLLHTGARVGEVFNLTWEDVNLLTWEDVNLELGTILLWTRKRKNGSRQSRLIPMSRPVKAILEQLLEPAKRTTSCSCVCGTC